MYALERVNYKNDISIKLVVPSACNASCPFCYMKSYPQKIIYTHEAVSEYLRNYISSIQYIMDQIGDKHPVSIDITGGEPTLNVPLLIEILRGLETFKIAERADRIVLTTNGYNLFKIIPYLKGVVDYVNISLHDYRFECREKILGFSHTDGKLYEMVHSLDDIGIKSSAVAVVYKPISHFRTWLYDFIRWCKGIGFIALRLRCDVFWDKQIQFDYYMNKAKKDPWFTTITSESSPDSLWCRLRGRDGFRLFFLHGVLDTSLVSPGVEYVIADDGKAYADFYKRVPIEEYKYSIGKVYDLVN